MEFRCWVIWRNVRLKFVELSMETPCWCSLEGHKHGRRKSMKTSGIHFCSSSDYFSLVNYYTTTLTSLLMLQLSKLLKITRRALFCTGESFVTDAVLVSRRVKSQKINILYFQDERRYRAENLWKEIYLSHLQPGGDKKSEDLAIYDFRILWRHVKTSNCGAFMERSCLNSPPRCLINMRKYPAILPDV